MKKILIIEDDSSHFEDIKKAFEKCNNSFEIYPQKNNDVDTDLNNMGFLMDSILKNDTDDNIFNLIVTKFKDIDLFVIDAVLVNSVSDDRLGIDFSNFLTKINYRLGFYKIIITSGHNYDKLGNLNFNFNSDTQFVSKSKWEHKFPNEIVKLAINLLNISDCNILENINSNSEKFYDKVWWITLIDKVEKHLINRFILLIIYLIVIITGIYALYGTVSIFFNSNFKNNDTNLLAYVEHIYLYVLPLFIVFSFLSYYKSTIEVKLTGGNIRDIDNEGAMKSLNNSKIILLSSLLFFTIIKIIDKLFENEDINVTSLISYGIFIIILIAFILLHNRNNN